MLDVYLIIVGENGWIIIIIIKISNIYINS